MKLRRVYETAEEEEKPIEEVAIDRFGSLEAFEEAKEERRILDEREGRRSSRGGQERSRNFASSQREQRYMFTDIGASGGSSRVSPFRRPGDSTPSTHSPSSGPSASASAAPNKRIDSLRLPPKGSPLSMLHTPIPTVMTPPPLISSGKKPLTTEELNRMQAKVLRAKLMGMLDAAKLEKEYEVEQKRAQGILERADENGKTSHTRLEALPTLDAQGRLYDVGTGREDPNATAPGNKRKWDKFETRDPKTGELIRYNADDDEQTLGEMLRNERLGAGMADQKNLDAELAAAITRDGKFENDLEYMDDNAEKLGRKKMRDDAMKRQFAING